MHHILNSFSTTNHELVIGGVPLTTLVARVGSTPLYVYDRERITDRVALLRKHLSPMLNVSYAMKANPMPAVLAHLASQVDGFDVSSLTEMTRALDTGMPATAISFSGPGKTEKEITCAVAAGVLLHVESLRELRAVIAAGIALGQTPRIALRINPDFAVKGVKIKMGGMTQFGVDPETVPEMLTMLTAAGLTCEGFHIFCGSQNLHADLAVTVVKDSLALLYRLSAQLPAPPRSLVLGGGFGIPYFPGDEPLDIAAVGKGLQPLLTEAKAHFPEAVIGMELGRYLVGEAGVYVARVIDTKTVREKTFVVTDGGLHHHLPASGNFGQFIRRNYPVAIGNRMNTPATEIVSIVGPLCTTLDLLADSVQLPHVSIGDLVVVFQSGAYGLTASPLDFLSHPHPVEVLV
ncbi:MAG: pyridoxal-dependent decarboxylase, exosortase A system-associated [Patescibacteria group bacterium]